MASFQPFWARSVATFVAMIVVPTLRIFQTGPPAGVCCVVPALAEALSDAYASAFFVSLEAMR